MAETTGTATVAKDFKKARNAGVPLLAIATVDQPAIVRALSTAFNGSAPPLLAWDAVRGLRGLNKSGESACNQTGMQPPQTVPFVGGMIAASKLPPESVIFAFNAHKQIEAGPMPLQAVANLRDDFKLNQRMLVLLAPSWTLPAELKPDVIVLTDPLPNAATLSGIVEQQYKNRTGPKGQALPDPTDTDISKAVEAVQGLGAFESEQQTAMAMGRTLDLPILWDRKCRSVAQASDGGLQIGQSPVRFDDIGGNQQFKKFARQLIDARWYSAVWFIDEIEKDMAAMHSDTSGTSQYQHKAILTFTQKHKIPGILLIGQPGSGKTLGAHAIAGEAGVPLAEMDLGGLKGKHVGESEQNTRRALDTLLAISQGRLLLIATCNDVGTLAQSPELLRRFKLPKFYFDLPTAEERALIWTISGTRYGVDVTDRPEDTDWTGSEIDAACELAGKLKISIREAAEWIIPMAESSAALVAKRRAEADGNYLSASYPGKYRRNYLPEVSDGAQRSRRIEVES